ncbi:MAG: restriction endonuclease subunit S [Terrimicrobiaceae bacterium]
MAGKLFETTVGEVCQVFDGPHATPTRLDAGPVFLGITSLNKGRIDLSASDHVSEEDFAKWTRRVTPKPGDVVFSYETKLGEAAIIPEGLRCCLGRRMGLMRPNPAKLDSRFLLFYYLGPEFQEVIRERTIHGSTVERLALIEFPQFPLRIPPLAEQKAIAAVLGALDDKIELNRRMNATLEALARALFQSWFVDFDPVRAKLDGRPPAALDPATAALFPDSFQDSSLGHIPMGWTAGKLGDIGTNSRRGIQPGDIAPNTPYIALEHMPRRCIALGDWDDSAVVASGKSAFKKGEILFGKLRPYFHKVGVAPFDGVCSTDILVLAPKSPEWFGFLLGHASSDELIQFTDLASTGTKMPRTNWSDISSFKVALPPKPIAAAFTRTIQPMLDRIHTNLYESRTLATLRDTLLPKLLSGELSVTKAVISSATE